jgi:hypothetical protein
MTHADFNDLETRDYVFKIGDRGKAIQARYDENTDALIFPRAVFDYVYKLLKEALSQEPCDDAISREAVIEWLKDKDIIKIFSQEETARKELKALSSVTQKSNNKYRKEAKRWKNKWLKSQKSGKWIDDEFGSKCSCCGIHTHLDKFDRPMKFKYCSMCGAKMESEDKE